MSRAAFPASFAQQRLWFLDQFEPNTAAYNLPRIFRITGPLNVDALTRAFQAVVQRHGSLRTVFDSVEGEARQVVLSSVEVKVPIVDLTAVPKAERETKALGLASEEGRRAFDLSAGPLLRATLIRLGAESWILVLVMHHIIADGWSISRLFRDVTRSYAAFVENAEPELPELPIEYTDYSQWQREYMNGEVLSQEVEHWKQTLAGAQSVLELPTDHPRPAAQTWNGARREMTLDSTTLAKLKGLAQKESATLFMVSMAAFQALLWRYTQQESILVGTPVAGRNRVEVENMVGLFVNTLVFRTDFTSELSYRELIGRVREYALEAYMHQEVPFEKLVEELVPQRSLARSPLFQVLFIFQNIPKQVFEISGLSIQEVGFETGIAKFDLSAEVWEDTEFHCQFEYNTDLFDAATMERMLGQFARLIAGAVENPDVGLAELPLLSGEEREQVVVEWNRTATEDSRAHSHSCIHELIERQAERSPNAVAVVAGSQEMSYGELNRRANQLARYLRKRGVGPEMRVGLSVDRGAGMVVALLGILKAGGAYVPLDPRLPDERLSFMLADAQPRLVITEGKLQRGVFGAETVLLDTDWNVIAEESTESPGQELSGETLAYVMYTSGSTGKPKGVAVEHGSVVNLLRSMQGEPGLTEQDVLLAVTTLSFDIAGLEIYLPLIGGARLVIASTEEVIDGNRLKDLLREQGITFMQATPATWRLLLGAGWEGTAGLKVLCGGEALPVELAQALTARAATVWNVYGPTETTIWSTVYRVTGQEEGTIPIGRPIANTSVYILDAHHNPVPVNVRGEIYIGGDGLARGYLNRPELTGERFVTHSLEPKQSSRLYRTGDLGRYRANGEIEYVGRVDSQVKLRGFRIELGEIESVLGGHASVREAVVMARGEGEQQKLTAYVVVAEGGAEPEAGELRRHLRTKLPEHMVPASYWRVESLPLLPSGKINRGALGEWPATALADEAEMVAPRNETEAKLAQIWQELLQVEQVGMEQNFFELGGHSLLALQVTARIRRMFEVELQVRTVFEAPTIAALGQELEKVRATGLKARAPILRHSPVTPGAKKEALPSFAQERLWFLDQFESGTAAYNISVVFRLTGPLNVDALTRAFQAVVQRHGSLRTVFDSVEGEARQVVLSSVEVKVPIVDLTAVPKAEREAKALALASEEGRRPFDLSAGPLLRATLIRLGAESWILVLVMHHIIADGWSISRLFRDVTRSYAAFVENAEPELPELPIEYTDYSQWQREYMNGEVLSQEVEHWKQTLAGAQSLLELPTDHPRPAAQTWNGARQEIRLDGAMLAKLKGLAQKESATLFMVSMAAFQALLWRYTQQESILVGTPVAGRNRVEVENMVGLFVNTLVFRTDFTPELSFRELIGRVREYALEAYMHQEVPFEKLVEELVPQRSLATSPLFQVLFIFQNIPKQVFEISGLSIQEVGFETGIAKFDLSAEVWEDTEFHCQFEYNTDLFDAATMERMLGQFARLMAGAVENPELAIAELPLLSGEEREQVVVEWNRTATEDSRAHSHSCIHELIERQAERSPNAVAVVAGSQEMSYGELNRRANQLARYLRKRGVGPEMRVGLSVDRGAGMVVALLGILKAGGAYVPLDPRLPDERLSFMLADAQPRLVITEGKLQRGVFGAETVLLDTDWNVIAEESTESPGQELSGETLAYVMYTSGSTGKPKGVAVEHGSVVNLLRSMQGEPGLTEQDVLLAVTTLSFDIAGLEIYLPLIGGARLVIASTEEVIDGNRLKDLLREQGITFMQATPATWRLLLGAGWEGTAGLKVLCGGEALPVELAKALTARAATVWNVYGPTETTIWSTLHRVTGQEEGTIPIGRPIANTSVYILDAHHNPVPVNVRGEIYIGGDGLARGYLNRAELTAERFVTRSLEPKQSSRLYRTGDLGRYRSNGEIEYVGRVDSQVKLRGFRIELGEIESVLAGQGSVREAVVMARGEGEQQKLTAYVVVAEGGAEPEAGELRRHLRTKLPEHMVPASYWRVESLPLLPSGKINREALGRWPATALADEAEMVAPRNETEAKLAQIWQELLQVEQVGIEQNFFELGGHSLLALQVTARIRRMFEVELQVRTVFEAPTIAALGQELEKVRATGLKARAPVFQSRHDAVAEATQEALLVALSKLSVEEAREFIENAVGRKTEL